MAFSLAERQALGIHGLLPPRFKTQEEQLELCKINIDRYTEPLNKYIYLMGLQVSRAEGERHRVFGMRALRKTTLRLHCLPARALINKTLCMKNRVPASKHRVQYYSEVNNGAGGDGEGGTSTWNIITTHASVSPTLPTTTVRLWDCSEGARSKSRRRRGTWPLTVCGGGVLVAGAAARLT